jgi:hypothetical protein
MGTQGSFGYKIGRKVRLMHIQYDADLLWYTCIRELYILMKHYGSIDLLREAFEKLKDAKNKPTQEAIEKCKYYTDLSVSYQSTSDWYCLLRNCQHSFINILDSGYFLNNGQQAGYVLLLDFNTNSVRFYGINYDKTEDEYEKATIEEIMDFDNMPTKTMSEILIDLKIKYDEHHEKLKKIDEEINNMNDIIKKARELRADKNTDDIQYIIQRANEFKKDYEFQYKILQSEYRYFNHRMHNLCNL